ncbi:MAG: hypothetical protein C5B54_02510 [Acidobacteria bacterium]|nr:MAG: hypothetical protein C5B54_02510 [Acidobacteriota bacterium]
MKPSSIYKRAQIDQQLKCFAVFCVILAPMIFGIIGLANLYSYAVPLSLFFIGWFTWTFAEYILHRFWNHSKEARNSSLVQRHNYHHTHPTDIYVSPTHRAIMFLICVMLVGLSLYFSTYILLIAGVWTGVFWFFLMHYFLHHKWAMKVFPKLVHYHVVHHCKEPDKCFGVSTTWWDTVFQTTPKKSKEISERILTFYYKKTKQEKKGFSISAMIDEKLEGKSSDH